MPGGIDMNDLERRDFYSMIASGIGGFLFFMLSIIFNASSEVVGMASVVGSLGGLAIYLKAISLFEKTMGIEWRRVEHG